MAAEPDEHRIKTSKWKGIKAYKNALAVATKTANKRRVYKNQSPNFENKQVNLDRGGITSKRRNK
jgi:hypothetical protein